MKIVVLQTTVRKIWRLRYLGFALSHKSMLAVLRGNEVEDQSIVGNYAVLPGTYLPSRHEYNIPDELQFSEHCSKTLNLDINFI
jgi:hypothetical protein